MLLLKNEKQYQGNVLAIIITFCIVSNNTLDEYNNNRIYFISLILFYLFILHLLHIIDIYNPETATLTLANLLITVEKMA